MAVDLGKFVGEVKERIELDELANQRVAIDAYNTIYQFLSIIRQPDGTPLTDSKNRMTSHLSGLFYRTISMMEKGIAPIFVFDGVPPAMKRRTIEARMNRRKEAYAEWQKAKTEGLIEEARIHAMASTKINKEIVESAKELLTYMGIPYIQAPGEGEAQAARMVRDKLVYAAASQDYDLFLFGADVVVRNLTITGRRKLPGKNVYVDVSVERVFLKKLLENLQLDRQRLVWIGILVGTDFNSGIEKVGPKTALKIVREHETLEDIVSYLEEKYQKNFDVDPKEVEKIFMQPETTEIRTEEFEKKMKDAKPDKEALMKFMCNEHDFSEDRISKFVDKLMGVKQSASQKGINNWM